MNDFQSMFSDEPFWVEVPGLGANGTRRHPKRVTLADDAHDLRFSEMQQAWREGSDFDELLGPNPLTLKAKVGVNGADNWRPDVAKVEILLNKAGYYTPPLDDGPTGYHNTTLDKSIRRFQKENKLAIDGVLAPEGETLRMLAQKLTAPADDMPVSQNGEGADMAQLATSLRLSSLPTVPTRRRDTGPAQSDAALSSTIMSDRFDRFAKGTFKREGGYVNDPDDAGGETNFGITQKTLDRYHKNESTDIKVPMSVDKITQDHARTIYKHNYFDKQLIGDINDDDTAAHIFDMVVLHSDRNAWGIIQDTVNKIDPSARLTVDGVVGPLTVNALNQLAPTQLRTFNNRLVDARLDYLNEIIRKKPTQEKFRKGWTRRANEFRL